LNPKLVRLIKEIQFNSPLRRYCFPRYRYQFSPPQLCFLCHSIEETRHIEGAISEVGCATGSTTVFLKKYMDAQKIAKDYYAIDTFSGFVPEDIEFEVTNRGKRRGLFSAFQVNRKKWFDATMRQNKISGVRSIEADVNAFDLRTIGPLAFCLLDVDLYRPIKKALGELYEALSPKGIIVVDDCDPTNVRWDGSDQAYKEFMKDINQPAQVVHRKLGVIRKPA
jgi:hypothetical protein